MYGIQSFRTSVRTHLLAVDFPICPPVMIGLHYGCQLAAGQATRLAGWHLHSHLAVCSLYLLSSGLLHSWCFQARIQINGHVQDFALRRHAPPTAEYGTRGGVSHNPVAWC